jgi:hypothetical protein
MKAKSAGYRATYRAKLNGKESAEPVSAPAEQCISDISIRGEFLDCDGP